MMKRNMTIVLAGLILGLLVAGYSAAASQDATTATAADQGERSDVLYSCACGAGCNCNSVSKVPGNCRCGKPMAWGHVVKVEGKEALLCNCAEGCTCQQDAADPSKCACGKPLKRVNLEGTEMFFCNCGGSCKCNTVAAEAGNCKCGMPLKQR